MRTQRSYFSYWKYKGAPPAPDSVPDAMINLREIARVVKHRDNFTFELYRADGEKVLVLKAETEMVRARPALLDQLVRPARVLLGCSYCSMVDLLVATFSSLDSLGSMRVI